MKSRTTFRPIRRQLNCLGALIGFALLLQTSLATAQVDLSGTYVGAVDQDVQLLFEGPNYADYAGIPINEQARAAALSHTPETISEVGRQCQPYSLHYLLEAAWGFRLWPTVDPETGAVIAWNLNGTIDREPTTIWMDGRKPPSAQALSTPAGFTTGSWEGDTLKTVTTHLQDGYLTRNGVPTSDQEVLTMFLTRQGSNLVITGVIQDPVNLTAPFVITNVFASDHSKPLDAVVGATNPNSCMSAEEVPSVLNGHVPSYLTPADNPNFMSMTTQYNIPHEAAMGGEHTMYAEFAQRIAPAYRPPAKYCGHYCCGSSFTVAGDQGFTTRCDAF